MLVGLFFCRAPQARKICFGSWFLRLHGFQVVEMLTTTAMLDVRKPYGGAELLTS